MVIGEQNAKSIAGFWRGLNLLEGDLGVGGPSEWATPRRGASMRQLETCELEANEP